MFKKLKNKQGADYAFSIKSKRIACRLANYNEDNLIFFHGGMFKYNSKKEIFNFNFNPLLEEINSFVARVLMTAFGENEFKGFTHKQTVIDTLLKNRIETTDSLIKKKIENEIVSLKSYLLIKSNELKEKLKFTYIGFDIGKTPIPIKLLKGSKNIIENDVLSLLAKGYFVSQVYSFFKITELTFTLLSNKRKKNRSHKEDIKYNKILDLLDELDKLKKLLKKFPDEERQEKIDLLRKIKKMGKEGENMHNLLRHLTSFPAYDGNSALCQGNIFHLCYR